MENQKAIEIIKKCTMLACEYHIKDKCNKDYSERDKDFEAAKEAAIAALEKQIPKKVIPTPKSDFYSFKCPCCEKHYAWCIRHLYCDCGQLLDWSDINII